jgi:hypothetical protein
MNTNSHKETSISELVSNRFKTTIKLVGAASPLSMHHRGVPAKTGLFGIMIMCPSGATCLPADDDYDFRFVLDQHCYIVHFAGFFSFF